MRCVPSMLLVGRLATATATARSRKQEVGGEIVGVGLCKVLCKGSLFPSCSAGEQVVCSC